MLFPKFHMTFRKFIYLLLNIFENAKLNLKLFEMKFLNLLNFFVHISICKKTHIYKGLQKPFFERKKKSVTENGIILN